MNTVSTSTQWLRRLLGLLVSFALFQWSAGILGSDRGQSGLVVGALVVASVIAAERAVFGATASRAVQTLGLGTPRMTGLVVAGREAAGARVGPGRGTATHAPTLSR